MRVEQTALEFLPEVFELPAEVITFLDEQKTQSDKTLISAMSKCAIPFLNGCLYTIFFYRNFMPLVSRSASHSPNFKMTGL